MGTEWGSWGEINGWNGYFNVFVQIFVFLNILAISSIISDVCYVSPTYIYHDTFALSLLINIEGI